ncbi:tau 95 subunit of transcription factor TFIIIC [Coemansia sp. RSA 2050]|nr:tau 95 subunit of transcription factor TFIIIC [Coemansia sp. RSA 2050]KAJ2735979.1 tau 95 subunit of transcription factor TFIIIC [Coemansia sp. BCRC 34962]
MPPKAKPKSKSKHGAGEEMAKRRPLPERTAFSIEYPGFVNNTDNAILTLGGADRVARHATSGIDERGPVQLRFRYNDPSSHPINGQKVATDNLLIKVTKRTRRLKSATGEVVGPAEFVSESVEVVAVIDKTARFRKLADFQYIVPKGDPLKQIAKALNKVDIDEAKRLCESGVLDSSLDASTGYIPAPFLDSTGWPSQYPLKDVTEAPNPDIEDNEDDAEKRRPKARPKKGPRFFGIIIKYTDSTVPTEPNPKALETVKDIPRSLIRKAQEILAQTPVVSRNAMEVLIPPSERQGCRLNQVMHSIAYLMQTGSWRSCWIRLGYDPRKEEEAYRYQVLDMRRKSTKEIAGRIRISRQGRGANIIRQPAQEDTAPKNAIEAQRYIFDATAAAQDMGGIYQLLHIEIPAIKDLINYPSGRRKRPCYESGWLQPSLSRLIQSKLRDSRRIYGEGSSETPDSLEANYDELDKAIAADRQAEELELNTEAILREREAGSVLCQVDRERLHANVDKLMRNLGEVENMEADDGEYDDGAGFDEFNIYGEESGAESQSDAAEDD